MGRKCFRILADIETDPLKILDGKLGIETGEKSVWYLLDVPGLYDLAFMACVMIGTICLLVAFMHYLVVSKRELKAEIKANIVQRMFILFVIGMAASIMDIFLIIGKWLNGG